MNQANAQPLTASRAFHWLVCALLVAAGVYAVVEHRAHLIGALPYLLLLACPLMHVFGHRHHGSHHHHDDSDQR